MLPVFPDDFHHALMTNITTGPRREVTVLIHPLVANGQNHHHAAPFQVRLGAIVNWDEVRTSLSSEWRLPCELAWLRYADYPPLKPDAIFVEIESEREELQLVIQCRHVTLQQR